MLPQGVSDIRWSERLIHSRLDPFLRKEKIDDKGIRLFGGGGGVVQPLDFFLRAV